MDDLRSILKWYMVEKAKVMSPPYVLLANWKDHNDLVEGFLSKAIRQHVEREFTEILLGRDKESTE